MKRAIVNIDGRKLADLRLSKGMTQRELGGLLGLTETRVRHIERSSSSGMYAHNFRKLAAAMQLEVQDLDAKLRPATPEESNVIASTEHAVPEIPLYDMSVAAGQWVDVSELAEASHARQADIGLFRIRIAGDSMSPKYKSGNVVEFLTVRFGRDLLDPGKDYYVQKSDGTATFKRLVGHKNEELILEAINARKYPHKMNVPWQEVARMARAVAIVTLVEG